jgi:predicted DNA-binding transcriptional regulator YafY
MERLAQLLYVLRQGGPGGVSATALLDVVQYGASDIDGRRRQLSRDIDQLRKAGWDIRNDAPAGEDARYRLVAGDLRIRVDFAPDEQAELQRIARIARLPVVAAMLAGDPAAGDAADAPDGVEAGFVAVPTDIGPLDPVLHAVRRRCLLRFVYKGVPREVHPRSLHPRAAGWYLYATETAAAPDAPAKLFRLDRMTDVEVDEPGTAREFSGDAERVSIDPITWPLDPPVVAVVETTTEHRPHVLDLLGAAEPDQGGAGDEEDRVVLRIPVTNRAAFRGRLYELGIRARLLGPDELRDEIRRDLYAVMGGLGR